MRNEKAGTVRRSPISASGVNAFRGESILDVWIRDTVTLADASRGCGNGLQVYLLSGTGLIRSSHCTHWSSDILRQARGERLGVHADRDCSVHKKPGKAKWGPRDVVEEQHLAGDSYDIDR